MAPVEIVADYRLYNVKGSALERLLRSNTLTKREIFEAFTQFDGEFRVAVLRGKRIDESEAPKTVGPKLFGSLKDYPDPRVFEQLQIREIKKRRASTFSHERKSAHIKLHKRACGPRSAAISWACGARRGY